MRIIADWPQSFRARLSSRTKDQRNTLANGIRVLGTAGVLVLLHTVFEAPPTPTVRLYLYAYLASGTFTLLCFYLGSSRFYEKAATFQLCVDVIFFTGALHFTGSTVTILTSLYPAIVVTVVMGWGLWRARLAVGLIALSYGVLLWLEASGVLPFDPYWPENGHIEGWFQNHYIWSRYPRWVYFVTVYFAVVTLTVVVYILSSYLMKRLEEVQTENARKESFVAVGELVAGAAHELNNPLGSAGSLLEALEDDLRALKNSGVPEEIRSELADTIERIGTSVARAQDVVRQLIDLSRHSLAPKEPLDIEPVVRDVVQILRAQYPEKADGITLDCAAGLPKVQGGALQLSQAILNVADNAAQVISPSGGKVHLSVKKNGAGVLVACEDNGPGMTPEILSQIFQPFFSTKGKGKGTGLGLYLSHQVVGRLGGEIRVSSQVGKGTRFEISLPLGTS
ncbi:MAG: HAMP domain-containing sensor histidine kinase [Bdellovibrionota bacterium]